MRHHIKTSAVLLAVLAILAIAFIFSGVYNIGANDPHYPIVYRALETLRDRSIAARSKAITVPDLTDAALIRQGAGNYHAMCTGCHLMPGMTDSEMHKGLYPQPPNLSQLRVDPARAFWVVKNGIKASGMPSWGASMSDQYLWGLVAFQQKLPDLSAEEYRALVSSSSGHSHGGGETDTNVKGGHSHEHGESNGPGESGASHDEPMPHSHDESMPHSHDESMPHSHDESAPHSHDASGGEEPAHRHSHGESAPEQGGGKTSAPAEPTAAVEKFQKALASGNTGAASELLDPAVQIFESGNIERTREQYASHHLIEDAKFLKTATIKLLSRAGDEKGELAWVGSESRIQDASGKALISTETMVLRKGAQGWRIVHIHWSSRPASAG